MPAVATNTNANFTGVLVRREHKTDQEYVQLVFKSAKETKLSISKNLQMVRSLTIGKTYRVIGPEYKLGSKHYIREPRTIPLNQKSGRSRKLWFIVAGIAALLLLSGSAFAAKYYVIDSKSVTTTPTQQQGQVEGTTNDQAENAQPATTANDQPTTSDNSALTPRSSRTGSTSTGMTNISSAPVSTVNPPAQPQALENNGSQPGGDGSAGGVDENGAIQPPPTGGDGTDGGALTP